MTTTPHAPRPRSRRLLLGAVPVLLFAIESRAAYASQVYPPEILTYLRTHPSPSGIPDRMKSPPDCTLCHDQSPGLAGTVHKYFGVSMRMLQPTLGQSRIGALDAALQESDAQGIDSDLDGVPDLDELRQGTDPNVQNGDASVPLPPPPPPLVTGCSVRPARTRTDRCFGGLGVALLGLAVRRRRRRIGSRDGAVTSSCAL